MEQHTLSSLIHLEVMYVQTQGGCRVFCGLYGMLSIFETDILLMVGHRHLRQYQKAENAHMVKTRAH